MMTLMPFLRSSEICWQMLLMTSRSSLPMPDVRIPVPSLYDHAFEVEICLKLPRLHVLFSQ